MVARNLRLAILVVLFSVPTLVPLMVHGAIPKQIVPDQYGCNGPGGCQSICAIVVLAKNVLDFGIFLAVVLSAVLFAWAGWSMLTAGGNTEVYAKGKKIFRNVFIGIVIILAGWIIVDTLLKTLTGSGLSGHGVCS